MSHPPQAEDATEESINMAVSASTRGVPGREKERTVADRLRIIISGFMGSL